MTLLGDGQIQMTLIWGRIGDIGGNEQVTLGGHTGDFRVDRQVTLRGTDMLH